MGDLRYVQLIEKHCSTYHIMCHVKWEKSFFSSPGISNISTINTISYTRLLLDTSYKLSVQILTFLSPSFIIFDCFSTTTFLKGNCVESYIQLIIETKPIGIYKPCNATSWMTMYERNSRQGVFLCCTHGPAPICILLC